MNKAIRLSLVFLSLLLSTSLWAQLTDKEKFSEGLYLVEDNRYSSALPYFMELYEKAEYKKNGNINYNIGLCILNSFNREEKAKAIPYLKIAVEQVKTNYQYLNENEKSAPIDAHYYLGKAQHQDNQFNDAAESFQTFLGLITDKYYLYNAAKRDLRMTEFAKKAILNPVKIIDNNLGNKLNGFYPDFSPVVTIDESAIYFTSRRLREDSSNYEIYDPIDGMMFEDIYVSYYNAETQEWLEPKPLNINTEGHEATVNLSIDGQTLYIYKDINGNGELYKSEFQYDSSGYEIWSDPEKLGSDINTKAYETHVTVTPDGRTLYFTSDREGGMGGKDIYFCRLLPTGEWALAQNAGAVLNSEYDEDGVFMHPDGVSMYFSSNGHQSMGGYDIMYSTLSDSGWSEPINLGYPINSVDDDVFFVTSPDGKRAYFSSFKSKGYGEKDIYMLELLDAEEKALTLYRGEFTFISRKVPPAGAEVTISDNETGLLVGSYTPRARDGQFSAILEPNKSYHFIYEAAAYETYEEDIYVPATANYQEIYKEIKLKPVRVGKGMDKITPAPLAKADLKGALIKDGKPLDSIKILLLTEQEDLLEKTETNDVGVFNFTKLDPSETYLIRVITDGENPILDYNVDLVNDQGETLSFKQIDDSTYIFVPTLEPLAYYESPEEERQPKSAVQNIEGAVTSNDLPVIGLNVLLLSYEKDLLNSAATDSLGKFNFMDLDLNNTYYIQFEGDFPEDVKLVIANEDFELMNFRKIDEGLYIYEPLYKVRLVNESNDLMQEETTDLVEAFNYQKLAIDQSYRIIYEADFPDQEMIVLKNKEGVEMEFIKVNEGVYQYNPPRAPIAAVQDIEGAVTSNDLPVIGLKVLLLSYEQDLLNSAATDSLGKFNFMDLDLNKTYYIQFEGDFPDDVKLVVANEDFDLMPFRKIDEGLYIYEPLYKVRLVDQTNQLMQEETTDLVEEFNYQKLKADQSYRIIYEADFPDTEFIEIKNDEGKIFKFKRVDAGVFEYVPLPFDDVRSYTMDVEDIEDVQETYPRPEELRGVIAYFQRYFIYNAKDINKQNENFVQFINDIAKLVEIRGYADIMITSSASKVPTATWKTNSILTKRRAYDTKRLLEEIFKARGITEDQYNFVDINTLITGPEYKGDFDTNMKEYEKYQYVRIFVK